MDLKSATTFGVHLKSGGPTSEVDSTPAPTPPPAALEEERRESSSSSAGAGAGSYDGSSAGGGAGVDVLKTASAADSPKPAACTHLQVKVFAGGFFGAPALKAVHGRFGRCANRHGHFME